MKFTKNISARGRWLRAVSGAAFIGAAAAAWLLGFGLGGDAGRWTLICAALTIGAFQVFEALSGWCVVRALGIRTPV